MLLVSKSGIVKINNETGVHTFGSEPVEVDDLIGASLLANYSDLAKIVEAVADVVEEVEAKDPLANRPITKLIRKARR